MKYNTDLDYPLNLIAAVFELDFDNEDDAALFDELSLIDDIAGSVEYVLYTLTEREKKVLKYRFVEKLTYEIAAKSESVTRERIRQIEVKALRKLRHPDRAKYLKYGVKNIIQRVSEDYYKQFCELEGKLIELCRINEKTADEIISDARLKAKYKSEELEELGLSVRSYNCLKRAGCDNIRDIAKLGCEGLKKVRNLGDHSLKEVTKKLEEYGYKIIGGRFIQNDKTQEMSEPPEEKVMQ